MDSYVSNPWLLIQFLNYMVGKEKYKVKIYSKFTFNYFIHILCIYWELSFLHEWKELKGRRGNACKPKFAIIFFHSWLFPSPKGFSKTKILCCLSFWGSVWTPLGCLVWDISFGLATRLMERLVIPCPCHWHRLESRSCLGLLDRILDSPLQLL